MSSTSTRTRTDRPAARRRWPWVLVVLVLVLGALAAVLGPRLYARSQEGRAAAPLSSPAAGAAAPTAAAPTAAADDPALEGAWTVTGGTAGYRVDEVLNGQDVTVTGRTERVGGELTVAGGALTAGTVTVDLASVTTDSGARDGQFRRLLGVEANPDATFTLTGPVPLGGLDEGTALALTLPGTLTLNGRDRDVQVPATAQRTAEGTVTVTGAVPVTWADFGVQAPDLGFVSVEDTGTVEFAVTAAPA
ncbi:YceI family protein [Kineococcus sp. SYSU DK005]|uniref:YceI family protein n=1 Tax=Kineococcus sp. SYSU DK005 TaxID=3383126 RepID=UPI003D7DBE52